jgi:hypothetical protein
MQEQPAAQDGGTGGAEPASRASQLEPEAQAEETRLGPTLPEAIRPFKDTPFGQCLEEKRLRVYGWIDPGYTYSSTGPGLLTVEPRENRFGNEFLLNQMAFVLERQLKPGEFSWGFKSLYYAGADAALLQPKGGIDDPPGNPRFSHDFRELYISAHLPILTEEGVDLKIGRQSTIIGYNSAMAPYRPFYSSDYQWFYSQDGAWTGALSIWHINKQLDVLAGVTLGANTFFTKRSENSICGIGQVNYWLQEEKKTLLSASVHFGENAIFAAPGRAGDFDTVVELRVQQNWNEHFTQVIQSNMGWDANVPGVGTGAWYGLWNLFIFHVNKTVDVNFRAEWFDDVNGTRTGFATNYEELTFGFDYHPCQWLRVRPEIRGDFSNNVPVFNNGNDRAQLTLAVDWLIQY